MVGPIIFISTHRIRGERIAEFEQHFLETAEQLRAGPVGATLYHAYGSEPGDAVSIVHVFPDAAAMASHMAGARSRAQEAYRFLDPQRFEVYGQTGAQIIDTMRSAIPPGRELDLRPRHIGGFVRGTDIA